MNLLEMNFIKKVIRLETVISLKKGPFDLFALIRNEDLSDKWDVLAAADWTEKDYDGSLDYLTKFFVDHLTTNELLTVSQILIRGIYDPMVKDFQKQATVEHGKYEIKNYSFYGFYADTVYLITCKLQVDKKLTTIVWMYLLSEWKKGKRKIESESILEYLREHKRSVPDYQLDKILEYFRNTKCIDGPRMIGSEAIKKHGNMIITKVNPACKPLASSGPA